MIDLFHYTPRIEYRDKSVILVSYRIYIRFFRQCVVVLFICIIFIFPKFTFFTYLMKFKQFSLHSHAIATKAMWRDKSN